MRSVVLLPELWPRCPRCEQLLTLHVLPPDDPREPAGERCQTSWWCDSRECQEHDGLLNEIGRIDEPRVIRGGEIQCSP